MTESIGGRDRGDHRGATAVIKKAVMCSHCSQRPKDVRLVAQLFYMIT